MSDEASKTRKILSGAVAESRKEAIRNVLIETQAMIEAFDVLAPIWKAKYNALIAAGFDEKQALELCCK